ncbi:dihydroorotate dehydrogenase B (NAD(+)), electron transfer subunit [bacterium BMS3Bbin04]|nr:dihydroorotate dehydrogenase B (NAD(+)), electron transfer subunit [bacterium BMS3Bbin04]
MKFLEDAVVHSKRELRPGIWSMWLISPDICREAQPGQFIHVKVADGLDPLLRRPLSISRVHGDQLELVWRVVGQGTHRMTQVSAGETMNLLGPLGKPFTRDVEVSNRLLVGGGLGLPPLVYLYEWFRGQGLDATLFLGVAGRDDIPLADDDPLLKDIVITAENSEGFRKGLVTEPVLEMLNEMDDDGLSDTMLYSCGPWGLVNALQRVIPHDRLKLAQVSLEQQMACGIGVCQGCAVKVDGGETPYQLVCHDGPVFPLADVHPPELR